jgi:hypothetical protein
VLNVSQSDEAVSEEDEEEDEASRDIRMWCMLHRSSAYSPYDHVRFKQ